MSTEEMLMARTPNVLQKSLSECLKKLCENFKEEFSLQKTLGEL